MSDTVATIIALIAAAALFGSMIALYLEFVRARRRQAADELDAQSVLITYRNDGGEFHEYTLDPESEESIRRFLQAMRERSREPTAGAR